ncbi:hypothetical protein DAI22_12g067700 [Oryza sativa Japonica Group]|nr:hypothetical protein DAI22_12g067700 [Oryza sativa Japonica Group]
MNDGSYPCSAIIRARSPLAAASGPEEGGGGGAGCCADSAAPGVSLRCSWRFHTTGQYLHRALACPSPSMKQVKCFHTSDRGAILLI